MPEDRTLSAGEERQLANLHIALNRACDFVCEYRNWRGEVATRQLRPISFWFGSTEWHPEPSLMLRAIDLVKGAERDFRVADFNLATLRAPQPSAI